MATPYSATGIGFLQHRAGDLVKGRYEVLSHLGGGNFGSVYRVRDNVVGNFLACKEMHVLNNPNTPNDERAAALDLFKREALTLATLRHPHIPSAYFEQEEGDWHVCPRCGFDFEGGSFCPAHGAQLLDISQRFYLMMDYIDGATLEEIAVEHLEKRGGPLPAAECLEWIAQVGSALRSLHKLGIVHRDIKPDNIKVRTSDGVAMLLDFGLTKKVEDAGGYGTMRITGTGRFGTPGYAPPSPGEQQNPESRSDIYALGMTLYRLLSARDPQDEDQLQEMRDHSARYFNPHLAPEIDRIIREATASERTNRYQKIDDFLDDINELRAPAQALTQSPPFTFSDGARARNAGDLARLVEKHPAESQNYLFNGMFGSWLLQNGYAASAKAAEDMVKEYPSKPGIALELFRRALYPTATPNILPRIEVQPESLSFGSLESGEQATLELKIRNAGPGLAWGTLETEGTSNTDKFTISLPGLKAPHEWEGNVTLAIHLDTGQSPSSAHSGALVVKCNDQTIRIPVDYNVRPLELRADPASLEFGILPVGARATRSLSIRPLKEGGPGIPRGSIYAGASLSGLVVPERFQGSEPIEIVLDGSAPDVVATFYEGSVQFDTNGGRLRVPVRYTFTLPFERLLTLIGGGALGGALGGMALRLLYAFLDPVYAWRWLYDPNEPFAPYEVRTLGPLLLCSAVGLLAGIALMRGGLLTRKSKAAWGSALPFAGLLLGGGFSPLLATALHWGMWWLGDWVLRPLAVGLPLAAFYRAAPLAWGAAGGVIGLLSGIGRSFAAVGVKGSVYGVYATIAAGFLAVLVNAMVHT